MGNERDSGRHCGYFEYDHCLFGELVYGIGAEAADNRNQRKGQNDARFRIDFLLVWEDFQKKAKPKEFGQICVYCATEEA